MTWRRLTGSLRSWRLLGGWRGGGMACSTRTRFLPRTGLPGWSGRRPGTGWGRVRRGRWRGGGIRAGWRVAGGGGGGGGRGGGGGGARGGGGRGGGAGAG